MIRFSAVLVAVATVLLIAGVVTSKLALVYVAIGVSGIALLALIAGAMLKRDELFGSQPSTLEAARAEVPQPGAASAGSSAGAASAAPVVSASPAASAASPGPAPAGPAAAGSSASAGPAQSASRTSGAAGATRAALPGDPFPPEAAWPPAGRPAQEQRPAAEQRPIEERRPGHAGGEPAWPRGGEPSKLPQAGRFAVPEAPSQPEAQPPPEPQPVPGMESPVAKPTVAAEAGHVEPEPTAPDSSTMAKTERPGEGVADATTSAAVLDGAVSDESVAEDTKATDATPTDATPTDAASAVVTPADAAPADTEQEPGGDATAGPESEHVQAERDVSREVTVVPGVPRYHNADCILIRFMGADDLERKPLADAEEAGCTPCRACLPG